MKKLSKIIIGIILFIILLIVSLIFLKNEAGETKSQKICCNNNCFNIEIADDNASRYLGLMYREYLGPDEGMLFIFNDTGIHSFWMKNTRIPLAGIRLDSDLKIVDIILMEPCKTEQCPPYKPQSEAQYVLEINQGIINERGLLHIGDSCKLTGDF